MNSKERWLASVQLKPVDRLVFWPKLREGYKSLQKSPYNNMELDEIYDYIGCDKHIRTKPSYIKEKRTNTQLEIKEKNDIREFIYKTKNGTTNYIEKYDKGSMSWHPVKMPIENYNDIRIMTSWYLDCNLEINKHIFENEKSDIKAIGSDALVSNYIGESPLMYFIEWLAGVENGNYLLIDYKEEIEELFEVMHRILLRKTEILSDLSISDMLFFEENTSTTLISPTQFNDYCFKHLKEYTEILKQNNRLVYLHMCGHIKALLPQLCKLPVNAFEAFTSPTLGNTTFYDGRSNCPSICLIGGTNAILWMKSANEIIEQIEKDLEKLPHQRGIVISSAGVMPPACEPDTIKKVFDWIKSYNIKQ